MHLDSHEAPKTNQTASVTAGGQRKAPADAAVDPATDKQEAQNAELSALREENRSLKEQLKACSENAQLISNTEKDQFALQQLIDLKTELTDAVCLLVTAYEAAAEKIDRLLEEPIPQAIENVQRTAPPTVPQTAADTPASQCILPGDTDENLKKLAKDLPDALPEDKKLSIIEALKNSARPAAHVKPTLAVTHKERANAKHLLQKYSKIK